MPEKKNLSKRVGLIDEVRGFAILCMVVYHAMYNLYAIFSIDVSWFFTPFMLGFLEPVFAGLFIFISGTACRYSRSNIKRGALCFGFGLVMTLGTWLFMPSQLIVFGILHFLGIAMVLYGLTGKWLDKIPAWAGILLSAFLLLLTWNVRMGYLGIDPLHIPLPVALYQSDWFSPLGFHSYSFFSADYFPILPWIFVFLAGSYFGKYLKSGRLPAFFYCAHLRPLAFVGRHSLVIYVLHQPVIFGAMWLIFRFTI